MNMDKTSADALSDMDQMADGLCRLINTMLIDARVKIAGRKVYPAAPDVQFANHQPKVIEPPVTDTPRCHHRETTTETVNFSQADKQTQELDIAHGSLFNSDQSVNAQSPDSSHEDKVKYIESDLSTQNIEPYVFNFTTPVMKAENDSNHELTQSTSLEFHKMKAKTDSLILRHDEQPSSFKFHNGIDRDLRSSHAQSDTMIDSWSLPVKPNDILVVGWIFWGLFIKKIACISQPFIENFVLEFCLYCSGPQSNSRSSNYHGQVYLNCFI